MKQYKLSGGVGPCLPSVDGRVTSGCHNRRASLCCFRCLLYHTVIHTDESRYIAGSVSQFCILNTPHRVRRPPLQYDHIKSLRHSAPPFLPASIHPSIRGHAPAPITLCRVCRWLAHRSVDRRSCPSSEGDPAMSMPSNGKKGGTLYYAMKYIASLALDLEGVS